ncbi:MAG TPA: DUF1080 domain-containing protein [Gemmataceae bacterium]|jgi:hypothetical protein
MRRLLAVLFVLSLAAPCRAADDAKPNTLTSKEIAEGWLLLFDGDTSFGWKVDGEVRAEKNELFLGGSKAATVTLPLTHFELRLEYRNVEGIGATNLVFDRSLAKLPRKSFTTIFTGIGKESVWSVLTLKVEPDLANPASGESFQMKSQMESGKPGFYQNNAKYGTKDPLTLRWEIPAGNKLAVRNVKLKPLGFKPVFNGKDLTGWKKFEADPKRAKSRFTVTEDGWLSIKNGPGDLQTSGEWADFVLQLDCRTNGDNLNSGVFFRCIPGEYQNGYEAQIQNQRAKGQRTYTIEEHDPRTHKLLDKKNIANWSQDYGTGAIYRRIPARRAAAKDREWFAMTVVAHGRHIATWVNGIQMVDWTDNRPENDNARNGCRLKKGPISLQGHDPTTDLSFRNIRIADLAGRN